MNIASFFRAVAAVLSGFIGIRKRDAADDDAKKIRLPHVLAAGILMIFSFVILILLVVKSVT